MDTAIPTHISPAELAARMGSPDAPLLLDVRRPARFADSTHLLANAQWCAPDALASVATDHPPREVVVYCVHGHEVSQQAADTLRQAGWQARFLSGGFEGGEPGVDAPHEIAEWRAVRPLVIRKRPDLGVDWGARLHLDHARAAQDRSRRLSLAGAPLHRPPGHVPLRADR